SILSLPVGPEVRGLGAVALGGAAGGGAAVEPGIGAGAGAPPARLIHQAAPSAKLATAPTAASRARRPDGHRGGGGAGRFMAMVGPVGRAGSPRMAIFSTSEPAASARSNRSDSRRSASENGIASTAVSMSRVDA